MVYGDTRQPTGPIWQFAPLLDMIEYRCPDETYTISRAVHLGRLTRFFAGCRHCPHAADTGALPPRQVKRLREVGPREPRRPLFHGEGAGGVYGNELTPADARRMAAAFGLCLRRESATPSTPLAVVAGDGRPVAPPWSPPSARDSVGPAATWSTLAPPPLPVSSWRSANSPPPAESSWAIRADSPARPD